MAAADAVVAFATLRAVPVTAALCAGASLVPFAADQPVAAVAFRTAVRGQDHFAVLTVLRQRIALVVLTAPAAITAVVVLFAAAFPCLAPAVAADLTLAATGIVPALDADPASADARLTVLVVAALGLTDATAAIAAVAVVITAAPGAIAALGLVVVAAVQVAAAGTVQSIGGGYFLAPVTLKSAAAFSLVYALVVTRLGLAADFGAVAVGAAPVVIAGLTGATGVGIFSTRRNLVFQQRAAFAVDALAPAADFALAAMRVIPALDAFAPGADQPLVTVPVAAAFLALMAALAGIAAQQPVAATLLAVRGPYFVIAARFAPAITAGAVRDAAVTAAFVALPTAIAVPIGATSLAFARAVIRRAALVIVATSLVALATGVGGAVASVAALGAVGPFGAIPAALLTRRAFRNGGAEMVDAIDARAEGRVGSNTIGGLATLSSAIADVVATDAFKASKVAGTVGACLAVGAGVLADAEVADFTVAAIAIATAFLAGTSTADAVAAPTMKDAVVDFARWFTGCPCAFVWKCAVIDHRVRRAG